MKGNELVRIEVWDENGFVELWLTGRNGRDRIVNIGGGRCYWVTSRRGVGVRWY